nr:hypothetical protein [Tanacetum cinerariifolium]
EEAGAEGSSKDPEMGDDYTIRGGTLVVLSVSTGPLSSSGLVSYPQKRKEGEVELRVQLRSYHSVW